MPSASGLMALRTIRPTVDLPVMVLEQYAAWQRASGVAPSTVSLWLRYLRRLDGDLLEATTSDLVAFLARDDWAPETRKSARAAIRSFYRWAAATGQVCLLYTSD